MSRTCKCSSKCYYKKNNFMQKYNTYSADPYLDKFRLINNVFISH